MGKKRAKQGTGGIEVRAGRYRAVLSRSVNGKRYREIRTFDAKADARAWLRSRTKHTLLGHQPFAGVRTLRQWVEHWLPTHQSRVAAGTYRTDLQTLQKHVLPRLGTCWVADMAPLNVTMFLVSLAKDGVSVSEQHKAGRTLRRVLNCAVEAGLIPSSPMARIKITPQPAAERRSLTRGQLLAVLEAADALGHGPLFRLWAETGLRPGELLGLKWEDWNPEGGVLFVRRSVDIGTGKLKEPKTRRSRRAIPLSPETAAVVEAHRSGRWPGSSPMFPTVTGLHWWQRNFRKDVFDPVVKKAGVVCSPYILRHSCASLLLAAGVTVSVVSERLGHGNAATTLRSYAHVLPGMQEAASATFGRLMNPRPEEPTPQKSPAHSSTITSIDPFPFSGSTVADSTTEGSTEKR